VGPYRETMTDLRGRFVEQIRQNGAPLTPELAAAFAAVPREAFVTNGFQRRDGTWADPGDPDFLDLVYRDDVLVTKFDGAIPVSSSSQPSLMAIMIAALGVRPGMSVLEIGAGTGYNAALLTALGARVTSVDVQEDVAARAAAALAGLGVTTATITHGDGYLGAPGEHFDRVIVTVGVAGISPQWLSQSSSPPPTFPPASSTSPSASPAAGLGSASPAAGSPSASLPSASSPGGQAAASLPGDPSSASSRGALEEPGGGGPASPAAGQGSTAADPSMAASATEPVAFGPGTAVSGPAVLGTDGGLSVPDPGTPASVSGGSGSGVVPAGSDGSDSVSGKAPAASGGPAVSAASGGPASHAVPAASGGSGSASGAVPSRAPGSGPDLSVSAADPDVAGLGSDEPAVGAGGSASGPGVSGRSPSDPGPSGGWWADSGGGLAIVPVEHAGMHPVLAVRGTPGGPVTASVVCSSGFMSAAGPLTADHPGAFPVAAPAGSLVEFRQVAAPRWDPPLDSLAYRDLWYAAGVWHRRASHAALRRDHSSLALLDETGTGGAIIVPSGAVLAGGRQAALYAADALKILERWTEAGRPPMQAWQVTLTLTGDPDAPIWVPAEWSLK
jgi:protein-L-isoaspartate O-methyltransferase